MLNSLPQNSILLPNSVNLNDVIEYINEYIQANHCENLSVDISFMNPIDAGFVSTICSTKHYIKYPEGKINWFTSSEFTNDFIRSLNLGNAEFVNA